MINKDIEHNLGKLAEEGLLKEKYDKESKDLVYGLTDNGVKYAEKLLRESKDARLFMLKIFFSEMKDKSKYEIIMEAARFFKSLGINIFGDIIEAVKEGRIIGIRINDKDEFLNLYDKI